jgi:hypothetical protein
MGCPKVPAQSADGSRVAARSGTDPGLPLMLRNRLQAAQWYSLR